MKVINKLSVNVKTFNDLQPGAVFILTDRADDHHNTTPMMKIEPVNPDSMSTKDSANAIDLTNGSYDWVYSDERVVEVCATITLEKAE